MNNLINKMIKPDFNVILLRLKIDDYDFYILNDLENKVPCKSKLYSLLYDIIYNYRPADMKCGYKNNIYKGTLTGNYSKIKQKYIRNNFLSFPENQAFNFTKEPIKIKDFAHSVKYLSKNERDIYSLLVIGYKIEEIAIAMNITVDKVSNKIVLIKDLLKEKY